jgi:hypothetical protein
MPNPTRRAAIATTALALTAPVSFAQSPPKTTGTSKPPAEIESLIDSHIHGFNTHDNNLFFTVFGDTAQTTWLEHLGSTSGMAQSRR